MRQGKHKELRSLSFSKRRPEAEDVFYEDCQEDDAALFVSLDWSKAKEEDVRELFYLPSVLTPVAFCYGLANALEVLSRKQRALMYSPLVGGLIDRIDTVEIPNSILAPLSQSEKEELEGFVVWLMSPSGSMRRCTCKFRRWFGRNFASFEGPCRS